ncbi:uncharacterized protein FYW61_008611 [Anableps anableps]
MGMLILLVAVFSALCGPSATFHQEEVCYGKDVMFPELIPAHVYKELYFTPSNGGKRKILMENRKAKDPRLKVTSYYLRLTDLTKKDEGVYVTLLSGKNSNLLRLKILDCAEKINKYYMHEWSYQVPRKTHYVEYTPFDNEDVTLILWNLTNLQSNNQRRGNVENNFWTISGVTQTDSGYYNFRQKDGTLESRVLFTVKENTRYYDPKVNDHILITNPWTGGPWTVTFKQDSEDKPVTVIEDGRLSWTANRFSGRMSVQRDGIEINHIEAEDSGTFEFRDQQGNLALSAQVDVIHESHHVVTFIVVAVIALLLGICCCYCCCCKRKCCKKDKSADAATEGSAVTYHDKSASASPAPVVYYHGTNQPTAPSYLNQTYPSVYPPHPVNPPVYTGSAAVSIEQPPSQPNTAMYPPQPVSVYPPQPEPSLYPPLSEVGPPASQESAAAPTSSSDILSSDAEPRFHLKGMAFPSAPLLSSDAPTSDVYNSDKLNFL